MPWDVHNHGPNNQSLDNHSLSVARIVAHAFRGKLKIKRSVSDEQLAKLLLTMRWVPRDPAMAEGWFVATLPTATLPTEPTIQSSSESQTPVGLIGLRWANKPDATRLADLLAGAWQNRLPLTTLGILMRGIIMHHACREGEAYIELVAADAQARGRGVGGALLEAAIDFATERGFDQLTLQVFAENPAVRLYERHGFEVVHQIDSRLTEYLMGHRYWLTMSRSLQCKPNGDADFNA